MATTKESHFSGEFKRGVSPSSKEISPSPLKEQIIKESEREAKPLLYNQFPLPYEGRGIKGVG